VRSRLRCVTAPNEHRGVFIRDFLFDSENGGHLFYPPDGYFPLISTLIRPQRSGFTGFIELSALLWWGIELWRTMDLAKANRPKMLTPAFPLAVR
jgi:hypothetical protein